ncbi:MAG: fused MFS/spermidine synthase [Patescibacteria group bacterium]|jgi:spermidine synthase
MKQDKLYNNWRLIILATSFSGASVLVYEIITSRILLLFFGNALTSVTIVLIVFLGGLSFGAALMTIFKNKIKQNALIFSILQLLIAFYGILILSQFIKLTLLFDIINNFISSDLILQLISSLIFIFIPTVLLGAIFPLAITMISDQPEANLDVKIAWLYTLDIFGSVIGAAIAGFFILPTFGNTITIVFAAGLNILASLIIFPKKNKLKTIWILLLFLFIFISYITTKKEPSYNIDKNISKSAYLGNDNILFYDKDLVLWQKPSPWGVVTVTKEKSGEDKNIMLNIDNREQCSLLDHGSESLIATGTLKNMENATVLNIGLGCGFTLSSILESNPKQVTVAEINPVVYEASKLFIDHTNNAIYNEKVNIIIQDGAKFLRTTNEKYDAIIIDIEKPIIAHSSPLYTVEYLRYAKEHLNKNGKIALWRYYSVDERYLKSLIATFKTVFDNIVFAEYNDTTLRPAVYLFIASDGPLSTEAIDVKGNSTELIESLKLIEDVPPNTIDKPTLEKYYK